MCGIAGWIDFNRDIKYETNTVRKMGKTLAPRGPDQQGIYADAHCCFAHRRLIVIDPQNGRQPMHRDGCTICYNGELYNTDEVREQLQALGFKFWSHSDTEVLLTAYIAWGSDCLRRLNGIFAFAVWEERTETLFLARDRLGVKPLYIYRFDKGLLFASEPKALLAHPYVKPVLDRESIAQIMLIGPARKPDSGIFSGIEALQPGCYIRFSKGAFCNKPYWRLTAEEHTEDLDETAEHIKWLLTDSIKRQLVSDVPLCTFLSGGLDSSIISAVAAEQFRSEGRELTTYSVDYKDNHENFRASLFQPDEDAPWIIRMSEFIRSNHKNVVIDTPQLAKALIDSTKARDCPGMADVDSSLYLFCKEVKRSFAVALSGECADEIFGGYPWYRNPQMLSSGGFPWAQSTTERAALVRPGLLADINPEAYVNEAANKTLAKTDYLETDTEADRRIREMFMLNVYWFMQTLLDRKDRCSMAHGLEVRVPFCDHRIVQYAYNIPAEMKFYREREKGLVRKAFDGILPSDVCWRKKSPYPKTHNPAYMRIVLKMTENVLADKNNRITEILSRDKLQELIASEGKSFEKNWYGQLMTGPQLFAYLIQLEAWLRQTEAEIKL